MRQKTFPEGDAATNTDRGPVAVGQADVVTGLFHRQHQGVGVLQEAAPGRCQAGSGAVTHEQSGAEIGLQVLDPGADRGLGHVQPAGGFQKTAVGGMARKVRACSMSLRVRFLPLYRSFR
jgi:hypothetical protein